MLFRSAHSKNWKFLGEVFVSKIRELNKIQGCQNVLVTGDTSASLRFLQAVNCWSKANRRCLKTVMK